MSEALQHKYYTSLRSLFQQDRGPPARMALEASEQLADFRPFGARVKAGLLPKQDAGHFRK